MQSRKFDDLEGPLESYKLEQGLGQRYLERMYKNKDKLHQVDGVTGFTETNGSVRTRAVQLAMTLRARNFKPTDVMAICSKQHAEQTVTVLGVILAGNIVGALNSDLSFVDGYHFIDKMKPKIIFCDQRVIGLIQRVLSEAGNSVMPCQIVTFGEKHGDLVTFDNFLSSKTDPEFQAALIRNPKQSVSFIIQTQGTTGVPKLVCISHYFVFIQTQFFLRLVNNLERMISFFPLCHLMQTVLTCLSFEEPIVRILPDNFCERTACMLIHDLRIDHAILGTDFAYRLCCSPAFQDYDNSCLQCIMVGGSVTTAESLSFMRSRAHTIKILQLYNITEAGIVSSFETNNYDVALEKSSSAGKLLPGIKVRIVGPNSLENLGPDMWGELLVKASNIMLGYFKSDGLNSLEKGYFKTGDIAEYDEDGYLYVQGSMDDQVMIDGEAIVPSYIEDIIISHPFVTEAAVIGNGKELVACVVKKVDSNLYEDKLRAYIAEKLSEKKVPSKIKFLLSLPKTSSGKVKKYELRNSVFNVRTKQSNSVTGVAL